MLECPPYYTMYGFNKEIIPAGFFTTDDEYFCAHSAPAQLRCKCPTSRVCIPFNDPWGNNVGVCNGIAPRNYILSGFIAFGLIVWAIVALYVFYARGRWWCDGFPLPVRFRTLYCGMPVICPPGQMVPNNMFAGYNSASFVDVQPRRRSSAHSHRSGGGHQHSTSSRRSRAESHDPRQQRLSRRTQQGTPTPS